MRRGVAGEGRIETIVAVVTDVANEARHNVEVTVAVDVRQRVVVVRTVRPSMRAASHGDLGGRPRRAAVVAVTQGRGVERGTTIPDVRELVPAPPRRAAAVDAAAAAAAFLVVLKPDDRVRRRLTVAAAAVREHDDHIGIAVAVEVARADLREARRRRVRCGPPIVETTVATFVDDDGPDRACAIPGRRGVSVVAEPRAGHRVAPGGMAVR